MTPIQPAQPIAPPPQNSNTSSIDSNSTSNGTDIDQAAQNISTFDLSSTSVNTTAIEQPSTIDSTNGNQTTTA